MAYVKLPMELTTEKFRNLQTALAEFVYYLPEDQRHTFQFRLAELDMIGHEIHAESGRIARASVMDLARVTKTKIEDFGTVSHNELKEICSRLEAQFAQATKIVSDWEKLQSYIKEDETLEKEWNRFMMLLKLRGGDDKEAK